MPCGVRVRSGEVRCRSARPDALFTTAQAQTNALVTQFREQFPIKETAGVRLVGSESKGTIPLRPQRNGALGL